MAPLASGAATTEPAPEDLAGALDELALLLLDNLEAVLAAGVESLERVRKRGAFDTVTEADRAIEELLFSWVNVRFPTDGFLGEEQGWRRGPTQHRDWIVDPIDGTENFANGIPWACSSVGLVSGAAALAGLIVDPFRRDRYCSASPQSGTTLNGEPCTVASGGDLAERIVLLEVPSGVPFTELGHVARFVVEQGGSARVMGSGALASALVASGRAHALVHLDPNIWDVAAGVALIHNGGGTTCGRDGAYLLGSTGPLVAGNAETCARLCQVLQRR